MVRSREYFPTSYKTDPRMIDGSHEGEGFIIPLGTDKPNPAPVFRREGNALGGLGQWSLGAVVVGGSIARPRAILPSLHACPRLDTSRAMAGFKFPISDQSPPLRY